MKNFLATAIGSAIGTLLYTALFSSAHQADLGRAAFVGIFCGIASYAWSRRKKA